ncbi:MAG: deoxyguanosinetriphosphate triphosphohydrolase [Firmicutes bacterium]|nr:deoxyguanosinetriphosphate triphosphohydrolase [Bacillota bacterium]
MSDFLSTTYQIEDKFLSPFACRAQDSKGRREPIPDDGLRTCFQRDRDRILHSKAFRRLKHKTQVFLSPEGDHYRTRLTHTLEVSQIARTVARALRLSEDLTEAIALGHDLGHTPYGHAGENVLNRYLPFSHAEQSLRMVDVLEKDGRGMNLTFEVRDGILNHSSKCNPSTLEGHVVSWSDRIAYINHDIDDALRAGVLQLVEIPQIYIEAFGQTHSKRINSMILDIIHHSFGKNLACPSERFTELIGGLREFMFERVYTAGEAKEEEQKAMAMLCYLFEYYLKNLDKIPGYILALDASDEQKVCDFISMMSDGYAVRRFEELTVPRGWSKL